MSNIIPPRPRMVGTKRRFAIVAAQFNGEYVQGLVTHATDELRRLAPNAAISLHQVPGAFEVPIVVREIASQKGAEAIIAVAVIMKGKTTHAENLASSVTDALQRIALDDGVPILNAVLSFDNAAHARERCLEDEINRGTEAARAAVQISGVMTELRARHTHG